MNLFKLEATLIVEFVRRELNAIARMIHTRSQMTILSETI